MERIKLSTNLYLDEYIPKELYLKHHDDIQFLMSLIHEDVIVTDQLLRDKFGAVTINNWWSGGERNYSGFRPDDCPIGAKHSDHKKGMASDKLFAKATPDEVRTYIKENWKTLGISRIEANVNWVHTSVAYTGLNKLEIFNP